MGSPLNPFEWLRTAQDWFAKTERSSGFRPYLIFCLLVFGLAVILLSLFRDVPHVPEVAMALLGLTVLGFIILYFVKALTDPEFCRSEIHVERMKKLEVEELGSESLRLDAEEAERRMLTQAEPDESRAKSPSTDKGEEG